MLLAAEARNERRVRAPICRRLLLCGRSITRPSSLYLRGYPSRPSLVRNTNNHYLEQQSSPTYQSTPYILARPSATVDGDITPSSTSHFPASRSQFSPGPSSGLAANDHSPSSHDHLPTLLLPLDNGRSSRVLPSLAGQVSSRRQLCLLCREFVLQLSPLRARELTLPPSELGSSSSHACFDLI